MFQVAGDDQERRPHSRSFDASCSDPRHGVWVLEHRPAELVVIFVVVFAHQRVCKRDGSDSCVCVCVCLRGFCGGLSKETRTAAYYADFPYVSLMMRQYARMKAAIQDEDATEKASA